MSANHEEAGQRAYAMTLRALEPARSVVVEACAGSGKTWLLASRIVRLLLAAPGCIGGDIVEAVGLAQSTVSEHLRILKAAAIITGEIDGPRVCYALNPAALAPLAAFIASLAPPPGGACCLCFQA